MLPGRAVVAAGAVGGGAAPDALVAAGAVAVLARGGVDASGAIARASAVSAFRAHMVSSDKSKYSIIWRSCGERNGAKWWSFKIAHSMRIRQG
jgi:hypothetical protein